MPGTFQDATGYRLYFDIIHINALFAKRAYTATSPAAMAVVTGKDYRTSAVTDVEAHFREPLAYRKKDSSSMTLPRYLFNMSLYPGMNYKIR